jgi:hypothetical protein
MSSSEMLLCIDKRLKRLEETTPLPDFPTKEISLEVAQPGLFDWSEERIENLQQIVFCGEDFDCHR